ncbi:MAG TPA: hypothetical protein ENJ87_13060, partial [Gammaproteobacteria bacterium]|nr:hypothetical protein [Gammaproteobacteria bacterium]
PDSNFLYQGPDSGILVEGSDIRIVQLLDKVKDNALDFAPSDSDIIFQLDVDQSMQLEIHVKNEGDFIPQVQLDSLFQGMFSYRPVNSELPHLGIGLYVSHKIAKFHHGQLRIANRRDKQGVEVVLVLPVVRSEYQ